MSGSVDWLDDGVVVVVISSMVIVVWSVDCEMIPIVIMRALEMGKFCMVVAVEHLSMVCVMLGAFVPVHS